MTLSMSSLKRIVFPFSLRRKSEVFSVRGLRGTGTGNGEAE